MNLMVQVLWEGQKEGRWNADAWLEPLPDTSWVRSFAAQVESSSNNHTLWYDVLIYCDLNN